MFLCAWNAAAPEADHIPEAGKEVAPLQQGEYPATGNPEADRVLGRLNSSDPEFDDCAEAAALIYKLVAEIKGPDGFATWKDAAIAARGAAQAAPAPVAEDAANWHWLASYLVGPRTDLDDEIVASESVNDLRKLVSAARAQAAQPEGGANANR